MAEPLPSTYDPTETEARRYREWEECGYFRADAERVLEGEREPYVIVIPPPNVTAVLHMGHGLNNTVQDVLIRWRRMQGRESLWVPGTDHAGIATQNVVERQLAQEDRTRYDLGRERFVERVWEWVDETGERILGQLRSIGASCDWSRTRFTLDPGLSRAVREVFVRLYEKGLIYRGNYIINWCPRCLTALSNEEAEPEDTEGKLYHLRYPVADGASSGLGAVVGPASGSDADADMDTDGEPAGPGAGGEAADSGSDGPEVVGTLPDGRRYLTVATTRPETMLGDTAVAVNPTDERYADLVGAEVELPLTGRRIPIVADEWVDPEFGSGAVKVTPAHDPNDFEIAKRHDLEVLDILTPEAVLNENVPERFRDLDRTEGRRAVVDALADEGLLEDVEEYAHAVPHCYRCDTVVEPRLSEQWFVRMKPLAEPALEASRDGRVRFHPQRYRKVYEDWLENIRDWCISRQLWWGHRIPVWYCRECDETIVAREDPTECSACGSSELEQDPDVLDTWFSSWLWPFSTLGWPEETDDLRAFYPTSTLVSAYDILFFWIARMIMAGLEFMGGVPFSDVYLTGMVKDHLGRNMSKSLGNGIDPLEVVDRFGADALRYTIVAAATPGGDIPMNYQDLDETFAPGRNFANKLWNAGRFALMNLDEGGAVRRVEEVEADLEPADRWILSRLSRTTADVTASLEAFRLHEAARTLYHFFWDELADWYLELIKPRLYGAEASEDDGGAEAAESTDRSRAAAQSTLVEALDGVLRLLHPIMPFISEELWQRLPRPEAEAEREPSLVVARWPEPRPEREDEAAEARMGALIELIGAVRSLRSEYHVPAGGEVRIRVANSPVELRDAIEAERRALDRLAKVTGVEFVDGGGTAAAGAGAHAVLKSGAELFVPLEGIIDVAEERSRLERELDRLEGLRRAAERKLANDQFLTKAPTEVVEREREKAASIRDQHERLSRKIAALT